MSAIPWPDTLQKRSIDLMVALQDLLATIDYDGPISLDQLWGDTERVDIALERFRDELCRVWPQDDQGETEDSPEPKIGERASEPR